MLTPDQIKMARAVLGWSTSELARHAGVAANTVIRFEKNENITLATMEKLQTALERADITFVPANGGPATIRPPRRRSELPSP